MERKPNSKDRNTKPRRISEKNRKGMRRSESIYRNNKGNNKEVIWQKKKRIIKTQNKRTSIVKDKEYLDKLCWNTIKKVYKWIASTN